jgi:hypothetical protein
MIPVYRAGWQLIKVRAVMLSSLISLPICLWWGLDLAWTYGLRPADGGMLAPWPQRLGFGALVASLGIAFVAAMWCYGSRYAAGIAFDPDTRRIHLDTVGFFGSHHHVLALTDLGRGRSCEGTNWATVTASIAIGHPVPLVDASWTAIWIAGWRWPLIIDQKGEVLHYELMRRFFVR